MTRLVVSRDGFALDAEPLRILSGALHYFRVHPEQWADRLRLLRGMGLNTVETYVAWNLHEVRRGRYDFAEGADLERFLELAAEAGLYAIVRPGPYICAEWDNGGFPAWLLADRNLRLRCVNECYLSEVDRWFDELIPRIAAHQLSRGGNVLMVQVENEYGSYGDDTAYLSYLADGLRSRGIDMPLFTSDGPTAFMLDGGTVDGAFATVNFGSNATEAFALQRRVRPQADDPLFCMEYWNGWFDHWGAEHHTRPAADAAEQLDEILSSGASVNLYMAHGGTNFGLYAGANYAEPADSDDSSGAGSTTGGLQPTITSYDYDAAIDERGAPTEKYWAFREVLGRYVELPPAPPAAAPPVLSPATVAMTEHVRLLDTLGEAQLNAAYPPTMEELGQQHGMVLYRGRLGGPREAMPLTLRGLGDRAMVLIDGVPVATLDRGDDPTGSPRVELDELGPDGCTIEILVEALGRINYGPRLGERKGITGGVLHGRQYVLGWSATPIALADLSGLRWNRPARHTVGPIYRRGRLEVAAPADTFLAFPGWQRGIAWANGFCLGRFDAAGPQRTLYVPGPVLRAGENEFVGLELAPDDVVANAGADADVRVDASAGSGADAGAGAGVGASPAPIIELRAEPDLGTAPPPTT